MKVSYDNEVDALYIRLGEEPPEGVTELSDGVNIDITSEGRIIGIELLEASRKIDMQTILVYSLDFDKQLLLKKAA